jgi:16S rRNA (adenine1518-N6/adenine1519-N6)-dimethyltransferase
MDHTPRKRFGQNFLNNPSIIEKIIKIIHPKPGDNIVEIGPGLGALTSHLVGHCGKITAIEIDRDLIQKLKIEYGDKINLIEGDVLEVNFTQILSKDEGHGSLRIVGNLPYNISTPLLFHLMEFLPLIKDMHFMLQKEVVDRMAAKPGNKDYGRLSVMLQYFCEIEPMLFVPPSAFTPPPKVDSMIVQLKPRAIENPVKDLSYFEKLVKQAFSQRRKTLSNTLKPLMTA